MKRSKNKQFTDADIDQFCQSVEEILVKIKDKSSTKKGKKVKVKDLLITDVDVDDDIVSLDDDDLLTFHD
ncbi:MAG: hypothetical protein Q7U10_01055 [Thermodesulfovibrionia bacterium]|nr:hypothetical protein [Thermodesulfovibrionia bacterium]